MNSNNIIEIAQQTVRIAIGATATLLETIQDSEKRSSAIGDLQAEFSQKSQQWAEKGEITEREAREKLEKILQKTPWKGSKDDRRADSGSYPTTTTSYTNTSELQSLKEQITSLRNELEQLRNNKN